MSHYAEASRTFSFDHKLNTCDAALQQLLKDKVTIKPGIFAH